MIITVDATPGVKGAIQLDFPGTIIGWSVIADVPCTLSVDVDRKASSPPPAVPAVPNTTTDKISANAPITLSGAQSASSSLSGVNSWTRSLAQWDVIQFNVTAAIALTRATLYLRIEAPTMKFVTVPRIASTVQVDNPYGIFLVG